MIQVRLGIFETNSSSTHSLVVCTDEELAKWKKGELVYIGNTKLEEFYKAYEGDICKNYHQFCYDLDVDYNKHTLEDGTVLNIICSYGYDS